MRTSTRKRNAAADADVENIPPPKRTRSETSANSPQAKSSARSKSSANKKANGATKTKSATSRKPSGKAAGKSPTTTHARKTTTAMNELPTAPTPPPRPANQIFFWGAGNFGQFGMGPDLLDEFDKPRKHTWVEKKMEEGVFGDETGAGLEAVAAGGLHTLFLDEKGTIWSCGANDDAALGRVTKDVPDPENPRNFMDVDVLTAIPHPLQTLVDEHFRAVRIAAGDSICAAISSEGELRVWGSFRAAEGSLGFSNGQKFQFTPVPILTLPRDEKVVSVAAGNNHLVVLTTHGNIYTWGAGEQGQLGRKIIERRKIHGTTPEKVTLKSRSLKAVAVGAGNYASFAVDQNGSVWAWGLNNMGQTGTGFEGPMEDNMVPQPKMVVGLSREELNGATVTSIVGGEHHTLFLTSAGEVYACGRATAGQLGLPPTHPARQSNPDEPRLQGMVPTPTLVPFPEPASEDPVVYISAGTHNNLAVTRAGALFSWGQGTQGELGVGGDVEIHVPAMIVRKEGGSWKAIAAACGGQHSMGLFRKKIAA